VERAAIDLAEAAILAGREGESFAAMITDQAENGARIQLCDAPVVARLQAPGLLPGTRLAVRLASVDLARRTLQFSAEP
jgi:exoribonuclease R